MYGKLFEQMYDGTLATEGPWQALVTFQQLIILADKNGTVDITPEAISRRTTIPLKIIQQGLAALEQPDPQSRTPDEDGRRIVRLSDSRAWGWRIVNHTKYRQIRSQDERRAYMREYQRKRRAQLAVNSVNNGVNSGGSESAMKNDHPVNSDVNTLLAKSTNCSKQEAGSIDGNGKPRRHKRLPATQCPTSFEVTDEMAAWAVSKGISPDHVLPETERFLNHHQGKGSLQADWLATWRTWILNGVKFMAERAGR